MTLLTDTGPTMPQPFGFALMRRSTELVLRLISHFDVTGTEHVPLDGPVLIASNHLHVFDGLVVEAVLPRRQTVFAADKWRGTIAGMLLKLGANVIWVARGEADRDALAQALEVLRQGQLLTISPEGTRSRTGGLLPGKNGPAYLASRASAPIVPIVCWGQERILRDLARLRRPQVHVRFAPAIHLPEGAEHARSRELERYTDELMMIMARMLPPEYRGVYADRVAGESQSTTGQSA